MLVREKGRELEEAGRAITLQSKSDFEWKRWERQGGRCSRQPCNPRNVCQGLWEVAHQRSPVFPRNEPAMLSQGWELPLGSMALGKHSYVRCSWMCVEHTLTAATMLCAEVTLLTLDVLQGPVMQNL